MKRILLALLLIPQLLFAQDFRHRYFHYDQYFDAPAPFNILANTTDGTDTNYINIGGGGATGDTRGGRIALGGNESAIAGRIDIVSGGSGDINVNPGGYLGWFFDRTGSNATNDFVFGGSSTATSIATIRGARADGSDDGVLNLCGGGACAAGRSGFIQIYGTEAPTYTGRIYISPDTAQATYFTVGTSGVWSIGADITQNPTNGGNLIISKNLTSLITGKTAKSADVVSAVSSEVSNYFFGTIPLMMARGDNSASPTSLILAKSRATDGTADTIVQDNDVVGRIYFQAADGTDFEPTASITVEIDGAPGANDVPGRIVFSTSPDGTRAPVEALRITSQGTTLVKGVAVGSLPASCAPGSLIRATDSNDCAAGGGDGAMCICVAAGTWALAHNY